MITAQTPTRSMLLGRRPTRLANRQGITLLEVLLAIGLFTLGMASLMHLLHTGSYAAMRGRLETDAASRCENVMSEIASHPSTTLDASFSDASWIIEIERKPTDLADLAEVHVRATHRAEPDLGQFELSQLIHLPASRDPDSLNQPRPVRFTGREAGAQHE